VTHLIEALIRKGQRQLQQTHSNYSLANDFCSKTRELFPQLKELFTQLQTIVPPEEYYRFINFWKNDLQNIVFVLSFIVWLESGQLVQLRDVENELGFPGKVHDNPNSWAIEIEDFLIGISFLPSELARLCVVSVISGDFELPVKIQRFVNDLYNGYRLLNLKNDFIRKRFDSMKYDLKKIEDVNFELAVRGLNKTKQEEIKIEQKSEPIPENTKPEETIIEPELKIEEKPEDPIPEEIVQRLEALKIESQSEVPELKIEVTTSIN